MIKLLAVGGALVVLVAVFLIAAFLLQRSVLFPAPRPSAVPHAGDAELIRLSLDPSVVSEAWWLPPTSLPGAPPQASPAPLIIFTHGNGELADYWLHEFDEPRAWGWAVLLLEYPGYGRSTGAPSEASILRAAAAAYEWARRDSRVDPTRIVAWGRSLGGGAAAWLAAERSLAGLILESSFTSTRPLAARFLLPGFLVRDPFDNLQALRRYHGPLLVLHGSRDEVVPVAEGRALAAAVPGAEFVELPCGHNDCARPWPRIRPFLVALGR